MNKTVKFLGVLSMSAVILAGCGNDKGSNEKGSNDSKAHSSSKESNNKHSDSNKQKVKKIEFSDYIKNNEHVFYELNTSGDITNDLSASGDVKDGISVDEFGETTAENSSILHRIIATKDGQTRDFDIDFSDNETYDFAGFSKYKGSELTNKLINAERKQNEDSNSSDGSSFISPQHILYADKNNTNYIYYLFNNETSISDERNEIIEHNSTSSSYNTSVKTFKYKGKYYSGIANANYDENDEDLSVYQILITEVDNKNQQIVLDSKDKFSDDDVIKYEDTDMGKDEKEKKKSDVDNL